ncbi:MAG: Uridine diphosphate glucose pyrophosphatase (EC [uncultured Sulfurovum sp.]|uniref:Uridine diphosphate glucose pyrophosphatase (EC) n=1 Tax=uncultured Sulfurovum sp. TaxID=269237 RepID=A0A6S6TVA4_9BACT|nr:MAG: Uridine diphosphate glucose pyrophosphatase (EC [uncultured Sulfurovum sp.]
MKNIIEEFVLYPLEKPNFVKTALVKYKQNGIEKSWEIVESHNSVAILIYHKERDAFVLVKQFRPPVYHRNGDGMTIELCAGLIDKEKSLLQIAQEEIEEECGFCVPLESIERITEVLSAVGTSGSKQVIYYVEVDESLRVSEGGGIEHEQIEVVEVPLEEAKKFMYDESIAKTVGLMFAFMWWFDRFER